MTKEFKHVALQTHGHFLVEPEAAEPRLPLLIGFHGYAETAELQLERMKLLGLAGRLRFVSIEAPNYFYTRGGAVVASWMTKRFREHAIEDLLAFVDEVLNYCAMQYASSEPPLLFGFSQGAALAYRYAAFGRRRSAALVAIGCDVPEDVLPRLEFFPPTLHLLAEDDELLPINIYSKTEEELAPHTPQLTLARCAGGHIPDQAALRLAADFLAKQL